MRYCTASLTILNEIDTGDTLFSRLRYSVRMVKYVRENVRVSATECRVVRCSAPRRVPAPDPRRARRRPPSAAVVPPQPAHDTYDGYDNVSLSHNPSRAQAGFTIAYDIPYVHRLAHLASIALFSRRARVAPSTFVMTVCRNRKAESGEPRETRQALHQKVPLDKGAVIPQPPARHRSAPHISLRSSPAGTSDAICDVRALLRPMRMAFCAARCCLACWCALERSCSRAAFSTDREM